MPSPLTRNIATFALVFSLFLLSGESAFPQAGKHLLDPKIRDVLHEELSGELAKEHVIQITRHHRIQGSRGYRAAANYVLDQLRSYGFSEQDAYIESFKSDGKVHYQTWQSPSGWDIESGELRMIEPHAERIVGYPEIAMSVMTYSNSGDVTAELVWVGRGTDDSDYAGKDVKDKFVLATGYGGSVHRLAVLKYGAKAVVCYLDDDRAREYPDMLQYTGMWPKSHELDRVTFGFNLTNRQGEKLKNLLGTGTKVVLRGQVQGIGLESYFMDVVVAHVRGTEFPDEEIVFTSHLDHPKESANDNASGSAAILDMARSMRSLIRENKMVPPKRSLRFLWVPEFFGTMAYIDAHPELKGAILGGKFLANLNLDMVGENTELLHSKLILTRTPDSMPSVLNDVIANMADMVDQMDVRTPRGSLSAFNYRVTPYSGGSDHMMFNERKVPGIMFSHSPDYTHHTSEDTPDKVDPVELERCEMIASGAALYLANLTPAQARNLTYLAYSQAAGRLAEAMGLASQMSEFGAQSTVEQMWFESQNILNHALQRELATVASVLNFNSEKSTQSLIRTLQEELRNHHRFYSQQLTTKAHAAGAPAETSPKAETEDQRVPVRLTRGPLDFGLPQGKLPEAERVWYTGKQFNLNGDLRFELINFVDGSRSVSDIRNALSAEFFPVSLNVVARYISDLVKVGALQWRE